jgi:small conductance mechanosensitive channel
MRYLPLGALLVALALLCFPPSASAQDARPAAPLEGPDEAPPPPPAPTAAPASAPAAVPAPLPAPPAAQAPQIDPERLRGLADALRDDETRARFLERLDTLIALYEPEATPPATLGERTLEWISDRVAQTSRQLVAVGAAFGDIPAAAAWLTQQVRDPDLRERWAELLLKIAAVLAAGFVAERVVGWAMRHVRRRLEGRSPAGWVSRLPYAVAHLLLDLLPVGAFALASYAALSALDPALRVRIVALTVVNATILIQTVLAVVRFLTSPRAPSLRLLPMDDEAAGYAYVWSRRIAYTVVYGYFVPEAAYVFGIPVGTYNGLLRVAGLLVAAMLVIVIMQNRRHVCRWIRGDDAPADAGDGAVVKGDRSTLRALSMRTFRRRLGDVWHLLAIAYVVVIYGIWALRIDGGFAFMLRATAVSIAVVVAARIALVVLDRALARGFAIPADLRRDFPRLESRANLYLPWLQTALRALVVAVAVLTVMDAWGLDTFGWLETPWGRTVASSAVSITLVLVVALAVWEVVSGLIERFLSGETRDGVRVERSARVRTLLPLLRNALLIVLVAFVGLIVLSEIGVNIAPLLAGAGVIGLAVGFGSQTLVKDVITGLFILFEDTIQVGDVVDVGGGHSGVVEAISIRAIRLRDVNGSVHTVPFSQVNTVKNLTKDFSFAVIDAAVDYASDVDEVFRALRETGADLQADPAFGPSILEPIDIMGVERFDDSAIVVRARIKTRPIRQWMVMREFNRRMKARFDGMGISIPFPQRTVHIRSDGAPPTPQEVAAAAGSG